MSTNLLGASSAVPQVLYSGYAGTTLASVYSPAASSSAKVWSATATNVSNRLVTTLTKGTTSTSGGTLTANTYFWVVSAVNSAGVTLASNEVTATTTGSTSSQALSWTAVSGAASYNIYRGTSSGGENVFYNTSSTSYTDTNATSTSGSPPTIPTYGFAVGFTYAIMQTGQSLAASNVVVSYYSLAAGDTLPLQQLTGDVALQASDVIATQATTASMVSVVLTGSVHS